jgi:hypothetical protein
MICTVKEGRYHGRRVLCETFAVITIVINTKRKSKTARFDFWEAQAGSLLVLAACQDGWF